MALRVRVHVHVHVHVRVCTLFLWTCSIYPVGCAFKERPLTLCESVSPSRTLRAAGRRRHAGRFSVEPQRTRLALGLRCGPDRVRVKPGRARQAQPDLVAVRRLVGACNATLFCCGLVLCRFQSAAKGEQQRRLGLLNVLLLTSRRVGRGNK